MAEKFNEFFTDIIFISTGEQVIPLQETNHEHAVLEIITKYENHTSISNIKRKNPEERLSYELSSTNEVEALIKEVKANKPMGTDTIPPKILVSLKESISEPVYFLFLEIYIQNRQFIYTCICLNNLRY